MRTTDKSEVASGICQDVKYVCKTFGNRNAGSEGERQTAEYFAERLSDCSDDVKTESFKLYPNAFTGWIPVSVTCVLLGIVAYFFSTLISLLMFVVGVIPVIFEFILYKRMFDPLYKEETSQNVTALKRCSGEVKRRLYFVANTDAGYESSVKYRLGGVMQILILSLDVISVAYFVAISIARWAIIGGIGAGIANGGMLYAGIAGLVFVIPLFLSYFMKSVKKVIDGANGNLSGCFVATEILKTLKDVQLENTEIGVILTGGGAVGLRGAKAWCEAHNNEIDNQNTVFIALNTLRELGSLNVCSSEMSGCVRNDKEALKLTLDAAQKMNLKCSSRSIPFGATDGAVFTQNGYKSVSIVAINRKLPDYYNTRYDSYDNMSEECIAECFGLAMEIVNEYSGKEVVNFSREQEQSVVSDGVEQENIAAQTQAASDETDNTQAVSSENEQISDGENV